ncbi:MAG: radical SAM family heme chaperone HemW [Desulfobacterales bacterium]|jgi:oxygen-independent coproporphyrinogen-3 oxidase|nr:radical SAM family heme chaperone HemW [Desulfobacterales bacterium]
MCSLQTADAGIYIHIPFCKRKCLYCDFYSVTDLDKRFSFVRSAQTEINMIDFPMPTVDTIYLGGGTPSLLAPEDVSALLDSVRRKFSVSNDPEITIEVNPGTVNLDKLKGCRTAGVNRVNIGIQSFQDPYLKLLGRIHDAREAIACFDLAREAGFENIGIDLIYGIPGQTVRMWKADLKTAIMLSPEHISGYLLTYEAGVPLSLALEKGNIIALSEKKTVGFFEMIRRVLTDAGYIQYEISNYAKSLPSRSRHNLKYWTFAPYIGIGPSAHSFINNCRFWNVRSVDDYMTLIESGKPPRAGSERPDFRQQATEAVFLSLRCAQGICINDFEKRFSVKFQQLFGRTIALFEAEGYMIQTDGFCRLTCKGMRYLDSIADRLVYDIYKENQVDSAAASNPT